MNVKTAWNENRFGYIDIKIKFGPRRLVKYCEHYLHVAWTMTENKNLAIV